jgi:hypothetical protein
MRPLTLLLVERLRRGLVTRNRNFGLFHHPDARAALRVYHLLRSLERDLLSNADLRLRVLRHPADGVTLRLEIPHLRARRTCALSQAEYRLLLDNPRVRALLCEGDACAP